MSSRDGSKDSEKKKVCRLGNISYDKTRNIIISAEVRASGIYHIFFLIFLFKESCINFSIYFIGS